MKQRLIQSNQLGQILSDRRRTARLSQAALAAKLGISQNRLSEIETDSGKLTVERLLEIVNLLGLEVVVQDRATIPSSSQTEW
jgi:HTH-type transcriptional regulator/antitoxin HipB